jgi:hypothetical protein
MESYQQKYSRPHPTKIHMKKTTLLQFWLLDAPFTVENNALIWTLVYWSITIFVLCSPDRVQSLNIQHCIVQCVPFVLSLRRFSSVAVARSSLRTTVLISNPLVWVKLRDFSVPSAPGLKVPVGVGSSHALEGGSSHKISASKFAWYFP